MYYFNLDPGAAFISYIFFSPSLKTNYFIAALSVGRFFAN